MLLDDAAQRVLEQFRDYSGLWGVCGGWSIDLAAGERLREHKDLDITVPRDDQLHIQAFLKQRGWTLQKVVSGTLLPWADGEVLTLPVHNVWCDHPAYPPNYLEILFSETDEQDFIFRKDARIRKALSEAFIGVSDDVMSLSVDIVLLYKSRNLTEANRRDFEMCVPFLSGSQRVWLLDALRRFHGDHAWLVDLA